MMGKFIGIRAAKNGLLVEFRDEWRSLKEAEPVVERWVVRDGNELHPLIEQLAARLTEEEGNRE